MGRLERKLDEDLIDRMAAGWAPSLRKAAKKKAKPVRLAASYRAARRNAARGLVWPGVETKRRHLPTVRLNRSKKWGDVPLTKPYR